MRLSQLLKDVEIIGKYEDLEITEIVTDSRNVTEGCVFICIRGASFDGHSAAAEAVKNGAAAVVAQDDTGLKNQVLVKNTRTARAYMAAAYYAYSSEKLKLIGITGTNGKTTTAHLIKGLLEHCGEKTGLIGTTGVFAGNRQLEGDGHTTPETLLLQKSFSDMVKESCRYCVMETSSIALAEGRVDGCRFKLGIFTNLTRDHLDYHVTMEEYLSAKRLLLLNSETVLVNIDDPYAKKISEGINGRLLTYSAESDEADFTAKNIVTGSDFIQFELLSLYGLIRLRLNIPGRFSVYNALASAAALLTLGFSADAVAEGFSGLHGVCGRMELVTTKLEYSVIIDYAHTPDALEKLLLSVNSFTSGKTILVFGCGGKRDREKRIIMGKIAGENAGVTVITSDNPRGESPQAIIDDILSGMYLTGAQYVTISDRYKAIEYAMSIAEPGDTVILAGKGHEAYQQLEAQKAVPFNERKIVTEIAARLKRHSG